jgi:hypothetical protein
MMHATNFMDDRDPLWNRESASSKMIGQGGSWQELENYQNIKPGMLDSADLLTSKKGNADEMACY